MFTKDKIAQNLPKHFHKIYMNPDDDMYCTPSYHDYLPCDDIEFIEEVNSQQALERNASKLFIGDDPIVHYEKVFEGGQN